VATFNCKIVKDNLVAGSQIINRLIGDNQPTFITAE
jgi:hypothetical protein